ncbi:MAG: glycosyltransferase [Candidatus Eisenbacteria sp.]|nr:glycosyltransferase [Candidatus Eisenbacteria bacterium]
MPDVLIYRHQLFRISESFITEQAGALRRFRALYAGRHCEGPPPAGAETVTLAGSPRREILQQVLWRDPRPLRRRLAQRRPVLVHAHFGVEGVYALPLARTLGVPLVTTFHGFDATVRDASLWLSRKPSWINYLLWRRRLAREGELFICVSNYIRQRLLARGFPPTRTRTHYIGVDTQALQPGDGSRDPHLILHVARLVAKKGTEVLIDALGRIARTHPRAHLVLIGDGPLRSRLTARAAAAGLAGRVRFLGARPRGEVLAWMGRAALLCQPSRGAPSGDREGLGMVLLEAAARGLPVVASRSGGMPEAVREPEAGRLAPEGDVEQLADALGELLGDERRLGRMSRAARQWVVEHFDLDTQTARLEALYEELL